MTFTARDIITQAQKDCGVLGLGQTMNAEDTNDALVRFQNMIAQWQVRRWLVPSLYDIAMPGNNEVSNRIGPGQFWNTLRPDKILAAYFIQLNSGVSSPVSFPLWPMLSYEDYSKISLKELNSWPTRYFYDNAFPYGNVFIWPIPTSAYEIHLILKSALGFATSILSGGVTAEGSGYTNGTYLAVPLISLSASPGSSSAIGTFVIGTSAIGGDVGMSATANITIAGGIITAFEIQNGGQFYKIGDTVTIDIAFAGGTGSGFIWTITDVTSNLDSPMELAPEYMEAMIYNLSVRLSAMYQMEPTPTTQKLARTSLKTIVGANTQVPTLNLVRIPGLRRRAGIVNANGGVVWADVA